MLAVASNLFGKSSSLAAYTLHNASPSSSSTHVASSPKSFNVGLWKVFGATHKTTAKDVSVWMFEKKILDGVRMDGAGRSAAQGKEWVLEQLRKEVSLTGSELSDEATSLSRLRHPDILHMVEPLEETRSELMFVTESVSSSLGTLLSAAKAKGGKLAEEVDLDEVEIQKGTLQIAKGLAFLHQQAKRVHLNLSPDAILVNTKVRDRSARADTRATGNCRVCPRPPHSRSRTGRRRNTSIPRSSSDCRPKSNGS